MILVQADTSIFIMNSTVIDKKLTHSWSYLDFNTLSSDKVKTKNIWKLNYKVRVLIRKRQLKILYIFNYPCVLKKHILKREPEENFVN